MFKRDFLFPLIVALLGLVFVLISFLIWLNDGKNNKLLKRKLYIGALILSLTNVISCGQPPEKVSCYKATKDTTQINKNTSFDSASENNNKDKNHQKNIDKGAIKQ